MAQNPIMMFDWGDTIMTDHPLLTIPMCEWPHVEAIEEKEEILRILHLKRTIVLVTGAIRSDEELIWRALERVNLDTYFQRIFCFKNTRFR